MKKVLLFTALFVLVLGTLPSSAITFGEPDGDGHPNVGAMIVQEPDGIRYFYCSGTLIAQNVFLTAAHSTAAAAANNVNPHNVWVTFDSVVAENAPCTEGPTTSTPTTAMTCMTCTMWPSSSWTNRSPTSSWQSYRRRGCSQR